MNDQVESNPAPVSKREPEILLNLTSLRYLKSIKNWSFFFAILGFIGLGLMVILGVVMIGVASYAPKTKFLVEFISIFNAVFAIVYFFPVLYLYKFSVKTESA